MEGPPSFRPSAVLQVHFVSKDEVIPEAGKEGEFQVRRNLEHQDFWKSCLAPEKLELKVLAARNPAVPHPKFGLHP